MNSNNLFRKMILLLVSLVFLGGLISLFWLGFKGNEIQKYTDFVFEYMTQARGNKSIEIMLWKVLVVFGLVLLVIFFIVNKNKKINDSVKIEGGISVITYILFFSLIAKSIVAYGYLFTICIIVLFVLGYRQNKIGEYIVSFICFQYAIRGIYQLISLFNIQFELLTMVIDVIAIIFTLVLVNIKKMYKNINFFILILQIFSTGIWVYFLRNKYLYNKELKIINVPRQVVIYTILLILFSIFVIYMTYKKNKNIKNNIFSNLSFVFFSLIISYNSFFGRGVIILEDTHHPFENIIGFQQVFDNGMVPFKEYMPISGMYSIIHGGFLKIFGNGLFSFYNVSTNIFYSLIIILFIYILSRLISKELLLLISLNCVFGDYDRSMFMLPIMLILSDPKIIAKKNIWLELWFILSLFNGLYYPLYGVAICIGFLPFGIYQIVTYAKSEEFLINLKKPVFYISWIICISIFIISIPFLYETFKHMLTMSSQSIYADSITRFGQCYSDDFSGILYSLFLNAFTFVFPVCFIWIGIFIVLYSIAKKDYRSGLLSLQVVIFPLISFLFTFIRIEQKIMYFRNAYIVLFSSIICIVLSYMIIEDKKIMRFIIAMALFINLFSIKHNMMVGEFVKNDAFDKLKPYFYIQDSMMFQYVYDSDKKNLGECFYHIEPYEYFTSSYEKIKNIKDEKIYGAFGTFGLYYIYGIKGYGVIDSDKMRGYEACKEQLKTIEDNNIKYIKISPIHNYYLYNYIVTSNKFLWDEDIECFVRASQYDSIDNSNIVTGFDDFGNNSASLGESYDTLLPIFKKVNDKINIDIIKNKLVYDIRFDEYSGNDFDFIYVDLNVPIKSIDKTQAPDGKREVIKKDNPFSFFIHKIKYNNNYFCKVEWVDDKNNKNYFKCELNRGKLLIPLGACKGWLNNMHNEIKIYLINENGEVVDMSENINIDFLQLRKI